MDAYISEPVIGYRDEKCTVGIRFKAPFASMFAHVDKQMKTLRKWVNAHGLAEEGPYFLRYHVIDMEGIMDIEVGFMTREPQPGEGVVQPGILPGGRYASLQYSRYALRGNKVLIDWLKDTHADVNKWQVPEGDAFGCRYEAYLTDYRVEPRKSKCVVDLAIQLGDGI